MEFRGRKLEVEGCGDGITDMESMHIAVQTRTQGQRFLIFPT